MSFFAHVELHFSDRAAESRRPAIYKDDHETSLPALGHPIVIWKPQEGVLNRARDPVGRHQEMKQTNVFNENHYGPAKAVSPQVMQKLYNRFKILRVVTEDDVKPERSTDVERTAAVEHTEAMACADAVEHSEAADHPELVTRSDAVESGSGEASSIGARIRFRPPSDTMQQKVLIGGNRLGLDVLSSDEDGDMREG
jgi:hypothetical protein